MSLEVSCHFKSCDKFNIMDYDCIGFDLDNTLCEYNILPCLEMEYNCLAEYLVSEKGYDPNFLLQPFDNFSINFLQKGLLLDFDNGNLLKVGESGVIIKASHGTKFMTDQDIKDFYGCDKKWQVTSEYSENVLRAWNGPLSEKIRATLDYFDMPACLVFARIIDSIDSKLDKPAKCYSVWPDILLGLQNMYKREHFSGNKGGYFQEIKSNPLKYVRKCTPDVTKRLKEIKETKITYLVTSSSSDFASFTAETCLGKHWKDYFDVIVFYAKKPGFFVGCLPFLELEGFTEKDPINPNDLALGNMYSQGNWHDLYQLFAKKLQKREPSCLYFGDNIVQDVFTPSKLTKCHTVAVIKELQFESCYQYEMCHINNLDTKLISTSWGSFFFEQSNGKNTFWGKMVKDNCKLAIPSISYLVQYPMNYEF